MFELALVADSGSTTTNWALVSASACLKKVDTTGINPYYLSQEEIVALLRKELLPAFSAEEQRQIGQIWFYGAGCSTESKRQLLRETLRTISPDAAIFADHDLMAAAKSCCGEGKGIACILGTGSNSCVYDGKTIKKNAISLGYFLGDEGSGTHIGKLFLTALLKKRLPAAVEKLVAEQYQLSPEEILNRIYQNNKPNRFIGQFSPFVSQHLNEFGELQMIVRQSFHDFIREFIAIYPESESYPIYFVGSVAYHFQEILCNTLTEAGYGLQKVIRYPIDGLVSYHQQHLNEAF